MSFIFVKHFERCYINKLALPSLPSLWCTYSVSLTLFPCFLFLLSMLRAQEMMRETWESCLGLYQWWMAIIVYLWRTGSLLKPGSWQSDNAPSPCHAFIIHLVRGGLGLSASCAKLSAGLTMFLAVVGVWLNSRVEKGSRFHACVITNKLS